MVHVVIDRQFPLFLKGFEDISYAGAITDSLVNSCTFATPGKLTLALLPLQKS